jgi:hypothetical protein
MTPDRRGVARPPLLADDAAIERVVQRIGDVGEFTDAQIRQIAAIALVAVSVDDADRQRRDETARQNRRRLHLLGRD